MNGQMNYHNGFRDKVEVNVSRPASYAQLVLGSEDRYKTFSDKFVKSKTANNFIVESSQPFLSGYFTRLAIPTISLKYAVPTIISGVNDKLSYYITNSAGVVQAQDLITLAPGYYTVDEMAAAIDAAMMGGYDLSCNVYDGGLRFQCGASYRFMFVGPNELINPGITSLKLYNVLGIPSTAVSTSADFVLSSNVYCSPFQGNYTSYIDICSDTLTKYQSVKDNMTRPVNNKAGVIARIYTVPFNQKEYTNDDLSTPVGRYKNGPYNIDTDYNNPKWIKWNPDEYIYSIDIQLYDQYGEFLYWTPSNNTEFDMTILASES